MGRRNASEDALNSRRFRGLLRTNTYITAGGTGGAPGPRIEAENMCPLALLKKLVEIECAIGVETDAALQEMVIEAQNQVLRMDEDSEADLRNSPEPSILSELPMAG